MGPLFVVIIVLIIVVIMLMPLDNPIKLMVELDDIQAELGLTWGNAGFALIATSRFSTGQTLFCLDFVRFVIRVCWKAQKCFRLL